MSDETQQPNPPPATQPAPRSARMLLGLLLMAGGLCLIYALALMEELAQSRQPGSQIVLSPEGDPLWEGTIPIKVRELPPRPTMPLPAPVLDSLPKERLILIPQDALDLRAMLESGRTPQPGEPEVLAGDLTHRDEVVLDNTTFRVVGKVHRGVSGFALCYLLLDSDLMRPHFTPEQGATEGWLDPNGMTHLQEGRVANQRLLRAKLLTGARTGLGITLGGILGLLCVVWGGTWLWLGLFRRAAQLRLGPLAPALREIAARPKFVASLHGLLYGAWFAAMLAACFYPETNLVGFRLVRGVFTEGDLSYVTQAYDSGHILMAALATFFHNYVVATILFSVLPSLFIPFAGLLKNILSFLAVGFVMAPLWTGLMSMFTFHSITMVLELEAYVIASFAISVLPIRVLRGLIAGNVVEEYRHGMSVVGSGTVLVGAMLALAALYEAATIILLG